MSDQANDRPWQLLCRDCFAWSEAASKGPSPRCAACGSHRLVAHQELRDLGLAHIDCDAFYASIEKRDAPELRDKPVLIGGGRRGVVAAACYVARLYGVRSAMPMFKALSACPDAVVIRPNMAKYREEGRKIREMMLELTPLVEPLSIDEAFLDLTGTQALHHAAPAETLARLARRIEQSLHLTVSIGLAPNKLLAKIASDLDKPRGFAVLGVSDAQDFLAEKPVGLLWGVGPSLKRALERHGITRIKHLLIYEEAELVGLFGSMGRRLYRFSRAQDDRTVEPNAPTKSVSAETTFDSDMDRLDHLAASLWPLCEKVAARLKRSEIAGQGVTLKLKTRDFRTLTRSRRLSEPTQLAERLYSEAYALLEQEADGRRFRLIGVGADSLVDGERADPPSLLEPDSQRRAKVEQAIDSVRSKLGNQAIVKGRSLPKRS
ncbi:DNA polymerase IV [Algihabitans albus]|uniref:DNA polymerase IV n=1 Tax=Algihabitans albus TaxID=2164067 RepID=UPI000E5C6C0F|nr:DNA polymerase IV [Algihabitans albus]